MLINISYFYSTCSILKCYIVMVNCVLFHVTPLIMDTRASKTETCTSMSLRLNLYDPTGMSLRLM